MPLIAPARPLGALVVHPFLHPQGCRGYLLMEPDAREAAVVDPHLDFAHSLVDAARTQGWRLRWVVDTHTHADHPSASGLLGAELGAERVAHAAARHAGVTHRPDDGETLELGSTRLTIRHAPGHTPDHMVIVSDGGVFTGDSLFIGSVARTDFLGGDAGQLFDTLHDVVLRLPPETVVYPGHDYAGRVDSTIARERSENPWLRVDDRDAFVRALTESAPPEPANMAALLRWNREGEALPPRITAAEARALVEAGGAGSVIDVRTPPEIEAEHIAGARAILLDEVADRWEEAMAVPPPRLILCRAGVRAEQARQILEARGLTGLTVIEGGILAYAEAGGRTEKGEMTGDVGGGCCAAPPPG